MSPRKSPEWYDFVPLPPGGKGPAPDPEGVTHDRYLQEGHLTGYLELTLEAVSPIHVGSGVVELSEDAGQVEREVVKGMARVRGQPVIPATSLKGALRSRYEMITPSCLGPIRTRAVERYSDNPRRSELPRKLIRQMPSELQRRAKGRYPPRITVEVAPEAIRPWQPCRPSKKKDPRSGLCPACALFGAEGLQGRVWFDDARVMGKIPSRSSLRIASLYQPRLHRAGPLTLHGWGRRTVVRVRELKGRKAYYRVQLGDVPTKGNVPLDYLPRGTRLRTRLHFRNVTPAELGGLIAALGIVKTRDLDRFPFRVGGGKPVGLGYLEVTLRGLYLFEGDDPWLAFDAQPRPVDRETITGWVEAFARNETLCYKEGWRALSEITRRDYQPGEGG